MIREAAKKTIFLVDSPLRGGGERVRGCPLKKIRTFFSRFFINKLGGGAKGLSGLSIFYSFPKAVQHQNGVKISPCHFSRKRSRLMFYADHFIEQIQNSKHRSSKALSKSKNYKYRNVIHREERKAKCPDLLP